MQEEWVFEKIGEEDDEAEAEGKGKSKSVAKASDGIFALRSAAYSTFLSVDETAGGKLELRCDSTSPSDPANRFLVRMQTEQLATAKRRREEEQAKRGLGGKKGDDGIVIMKPGESFGDLEERLMCAQSASLSTRSNAMSRLQSPESSSRRRSARIVDGVCLGSQESPERRASRGRDVGQAVEAQERPLRQGEHPGPLTK